MVSPGQIEKSIPRMKLLSDSGKGNESTLPQKNRKKKKQKATTNKQTRKQGNNEEASLEVSSEWRNFLELQDDSP